MEPADIGPGRKVDIHEMDGVIMERCIPWITATDHITSEAALEEYIDAILQIISFDERNPSHRHDVLEQAIAVINTLVNHYGRGRSLYTNQETRMYMVDQYQRRLAEKILDVKNGNSIRPEQQQIDRRRDELRLNFKKTMWVDSIDIPQTEHPMLPDANDWKKFENIEAMIQVDYRDEEARDVSLERLKKMTQGNSDIQVIAIEEDNIHSIQISPTNLSDRSIVFVENVLQPYLKLLRESGYPKIDTLKKDFPPCLISHWRQKPKIG